MTATIPRYTIILDLDETLVSIESKHKNNHDFSFTGPDGEIYYVKKRPGVDDFLAYINGRFNVIVWSAGLDFYVDAVVRELFKDLSMPKHVFSREFCDIGPNFYVVKPIDKIRHLIGNTDYALFLDDNPTTFSKNPENAIWVNEYTGQNDDLTMTHLKAVLKDLETKPLKVEHIYKPLFRNVYNP